MSRIIVAEISKNWTLGRVKQTTLLSQEFERVINANERRGYILKDWKMSTTCHNGTLNETIVAIFERNHYQ